MTIETTTIIRELASGDAEACDAVLASLPYFFGDPDGIRQCHDAVRTQRGFVAEIGGILRGFLTLEQRQAGSTEITWMAVDAEHRRLGIGGLLIEAAVASERERGMRMLFVLTAGEADEPDRPGDNYTGTRRFYREHEFVPLMELTPAGWNQSALVLTRAL